MATVYTNVTRDYKDLDLNMNIHPVRKDVNKHVGDLAVINSIKNILSTNKNERLFNPSFGGNIRALLFENADNLTAIRMEKQIVNLVENFEPRASISKVVVTPEPDTNAFKVYLEFFIVNRTDPIAITFQLERTR
jgi:phage baseplate assembly protein W